MDFLFPYVLLLLFLAPVPGIMAVVFGFVSLWQIRKSAGRQKGAGMAIAGIILGCLSLGIALLLLFYFLVAGPGLR